MLLCFSVTVTWNCMVQTSEWQGYCRGLSVFMRTAVFCAVDWCRWGGLPRIFWELAHPNIPGGNSREFLEISNFWHPKREFPVALSLSGADAKTLMSKPRLWELTIKKSRILSQIRESQSCSTQFIGNSQLNVSQNAPWQPTIAISYVHSSALRHSEVAK